VLEKALTHCSQHASCKYPQSYWIHNRVSFLAS
jgi:hypothetical protein